MKKSSNAFRVILLMLCGMTLGVNIYMANAKNLVGNHMPMPFGYGAAVVLSGSMEPELSKGDLIFVKETESFDIGEIVVYQDVNCLVVHRIVSMDEDTVTAKGDANNVADDPVALTTVKGKVIFWIPLVGHLVSFLKTGVGTILTLIVAFLLIEVPRRKEKKQDDVMRAEILAEIERLRNEK